ncbi:hypothetical protein F444_07025 [Phytophthora nicotianae P1976]|uniref:Transmembrane protein n=1 Tax=Phytophthora nicotianae P1976 TaxID=1317066 RepID=A0A081AG35_PHYNI|nr:hypothetical protein F444_07025 [Phytophthora nicotianae P1976]
MDQGNSSSAYRDMGDELVEETNGVCHESPAKKSFFSPKLSESMILHLKQRRAVRAKVVVILSLLLSASVAAASLYTLVDATALTMKMRGAYPIFRGTSSVPKKSEVYSGEGVPNVGDAMLSTDVTATQRETDYAQDDAMLEDLDPYDEFHPVGRQIVTDKI